MKPNRKIINGKSKISKHLEKLEDSIDRVETRYNNINTPDYSIKLHSTLGNTNIKDLNIITDSRIEPYNSGEKFDTIFNTYKNKISSLTIEYLNKTSNSLQTILEITKDTISEIIDKKDPIAVVKFVDQSLSLIIRLAHSGEVNIKSETLQPIYNEIMDSVFLNNNSQDEICSVFLSDIVSNYIDMFLLSLNYIRDKLSMIQKLLNCKSKSDNSITSKLDKSLLNFLTKIYFILQYIDSNTYKFEGNYIKEKTTKRKIKQLNEKCWYLLIMGLIYKKIDCVVHQYIVNEIINYFAKNLFNKINQPLHYSPIYLDFFLGK